MSFKLDMTSILQYSYNLFGSFSPLVYLYAGSAVAIFIIFAIIDRVRGSKP